MIAVDIAAETWRREHKEIPNPGGYLQSLCSSLVIPSWYLSPDDRKAKSQDAEERRLFSSKAQEDKNAEGEKETRAREAYWASISETDRDKYQQAAKDSMNPCFEVPSVAIAAIAKNLAWNAGHK